MILPSDQWFTSVCGEDSRITSEFESLAGVMFASKREGSRNTAQCFFFRDVAASHNLSWN